ncbi:MAG TPA: glutamine synthetase family protein [Caldilineaceae bacterium]|nr:glutamine synthetase family protein [Caldilineaceae bacterium]
MAALLGMLTLDQLAERLNNGTIDTVLVVFTDHYGRFMGKRFDAEYFLEEIARHGTHGCDYLLTVDMEMDPVPGYRFANWERGYGDFHLVPDLQTLRVASWLDRTALVLCDVENEKSHGPVTVAPRSILRRQIDTAEALGFAAKAASELEYFIFQDSYRDAAGKNYQDLTPAGWYIEDYHTLQGTREEAFNGAVRRHLRLSGIPVENSKGEWGQGQHELNVRYADVLTMADRHAIYKQCLKEIADGMGISVTFMAKFAANAAGSSSHIHLSLWHKGQNAFAGEHEFGPVRCSESFRWFLGGWLHHLPELMVFYAPTINSYKRYQAGSWAPTRIAWSYDNRTAGFRVVGHNQSLRIECRVPGADCNPYLVYAAAIASGLDGLAKQIEPPPIFEGDVYAAQHLPRVPMSLREATDLFAHSDFAKEAFGDDVVEHYTHFFRNEQAAFDSAVTDWERRRYFERI